MKTKEELFTLLKAGKTEKEAMQMAVTELAAYLERTYPLQITVAQPIEQRQYPHSACTYSGRIDFILNGYTYRTQRLKTLVEHIYAEPTNEQTLLQIIYNAI